MRKLEAMAPRADIVAHHDAQIDNLNNRVGHVEKTLSGHGMMLQEIRDAVTKQSARPTLDPRNTIGIIKDLGVVFAMVCAGILYLAAQNGSTAVALLQDHEKQAAERLDRVESLVLPSSWAGK